MRDLCPTIDEALLEYLETQFPDRAADPDKSDPMKVFGHQVVIRHLRAAYEEQQENPNVWT